MMTKKLQKRFLKLEEEMKKVEETKYHSNTRYSDGKYVDNEVFSKWKIKTKNLINKLCGENSDYYKEFVKKEKPLNYSTNFNTYKRLKPIFIALKEDFEDGYFTEDLEVSIDNKYFGDIQELLNLNKEFKKHIEVEEITPYQKEILLEICNDIDNTIIKYKKTENKVVFKKLYENLIGKLIIYKEELQKIDSKILKEVLVKIYTKIESLNKIMNIIVKIISKGKDIIDLLTF